MNSDTFRFLSTHLPPEIVAEIDNHLIALYKKDSQRILLVAMSAVYSLKEDEGFHFLRIGCHHTVWAFTNICEKCGDIYRKSVRNIITGEFTKIPIEKMARSHNKLCNTLP